MQLEIFYHSKQLGLSSFSLPILSIKLWWLELVELLMQEHRSKPTTHQPSSTSKHAFNGKERGTVLSVLNLKFQ
jgi:hypothetical protein